MRRSLRQIPRRTKPCAALVAFLLITTQGFAAELPRQVERGHSSATVPGEYDTQDVAALAELPAHIQRAIAAHLKDRFGEAYAARLTFDGGQKADLKPGRTETPGRQRKMFTYRIGFTLAAPDMGIARYTAYLWLDKDGRVLRDLELPRVATSPDKSNLVPLDCAYKAADTLGISPTTADIAYDHDTDSLVYVLRQESQGADAGRGRETCLVQRHTAAVSAHTCELLHNETGYMRPYSCTPGRADPQPPSN